MSLQSTTTALQQRIGRRACLNALRSLFICPAELAAKEATLSSNNFVHQTLFHALAQAHVHSAPNKLEALSEPLFHTQKIITMLTCALRYVWVITFSRYDALTRFVRIPKPRLEADYIVVGVGGAGSPLAARMAAAGLDVLLLEEGTNNAGPHFSTFFQKLYRPLRSEQEPRLCSWRAARGVGCQ
eukprot:795791-Pleurochrysis_carterae.AAC.7